MTEITLFLILLAVLFGVPAVLLALKDKYLKKLGFSKDKIDRIGVIWLVTPVAILISTLFILGGWWAAQNASQTNSFLFGAVTGTIFGILLVLLTFKTTKQQIEIRRSKIQKSIFWASIGIFVIKAGVDKLVYLLLDLHLSTTFVLTGFASVLSLFAFIGHFVLATFKKVTVLP